MRFHFKKYCTALLFILCLAALPAQADNARQIATAAQNQVGQTIYYDPAYVRLSYPGGDVPLERGVCSDVVIRALRSVGIDLQVLINQDMKAYFKAYPQNWGLSRPDPNIDHRRVLNIIAYYQRQKCSLPLPVEIANLQPGDLITWTLPHNLPHIGVVTVINGSQVLLVHNIGLGAREEAVLYNWPITAHLRVILPQQGSQP